MIMKLIEIMIQEQNWEIWKICFLMMYILSARFQLENWNAPAWLDWAQNLFYSSRLSSGNFSSNSSLVCRYKSWITGFDFSTYWGFTYCKKVHMNIEKKRHGNASSIMISPFCEVARVRLNSGSTSCHDGRFCCWYIVVWYLEMYIQYDQ